MTPIEQKKFTQRIDEVSANLTYIGIIKFEDAKQVLLDGIHVTIEAAPKWSIQRITVTGTVTAIDYSTGSLDYTSIWDKRTSVTYA